MSLNYPNKFVSAMAIVAASLTLAGAVIAQAPPDGPVQGGPDGNFGPGPGTAPGFNQQPGMNGQKYNNQGNGPWGGGRRRHMRRTGQGMGPGNQMGPVIGQGQNGMGGGKEARRQKMMQRFDANGDGQLDSGEQAQLQQFKEQRRAQREAQGGGMSQGQNMGPGMGQGMRRHGMRGGKRRWQQGGPGFNQGQQGFNQNGAIQQGFAPGPNNGPPPNEMNPIPGNQTNPTNPTNPNGMGQIQPFQNIPQNPPQ